MALDGNFNEEYKKRKGRCKEMAKKLYMSPLTTMDAFTVYETKFLLAMCYLLHIAILEHSKLAATQKCFTNLLLQKSINRKNQGQLSMHQLQCKQMIKHLHLFQGHIRRKGTVVESYLTQLRAHQIETRIKTPIF